jgi:aspartate carbamoyltransferase catalytic subunit
MSPGITTRRQTSASRWQARHVIDPEMAPSHWLSIADIGRPVAGTILDRAADLAEQPTFRPSLTRKVIGLLFFQPSTRTRVGFEVAARRLGGASVVVEHTKFQPGMDGSESVEDTVRVLAGYCDLLVLRCADVEVLARAAARSRVPVISGGGGRRHHPTQALVDLFAIRSLRGTVDGLRIGVAGDLLNSRTAHSFVEALAWYAPLEVRLMSPPERRIDTAVLQAFDPGRITLCNDFSATNLDVVYMAGMPPGVGDQALPDDVRARFRLTQERMTGLPERSFVLCAMPRTGDIDPEVDEDPRAAYFQQSDWAAYVRMAILEHLLEVDRVQTP